MGGKYNADDDPRVQEERAERAKKEAEIRRRTERRAWRELRDIYERCIAISEKAWKERLAQAEAQQRTLAEAMRDRLRRVRVGVTEVETEESAEIPVPLFTPRDRLQFLKESAATLLIFAERRGLTVTPEPKEAEK